MRILISGGAGFIGGHVVDRLRADHKLLVLDQQQLNPTDSSCRHHNVTKVVADICSSKAAAAIWKFAPEAVVHLAAQVNVPASMLRSADNVRVNLTGLMNVYKAARDSGSKSFVFASSGGAIYSNPNVLPATKDTLAVPASVYGLSKRNGKDYPNMVTANSNMRCVNLRFANVYGPWQASHGEGGVVATFTRKMLDGIVPVIFGDGEQTHDFVFVKDVAVAVEHAINSQASGTFNIATNMELSLNGLVRLLKQITGFDEEIKFALKRDGKVNCSRLSFDKAERDLLWRPQTDILTGLMETVEEAYRSDLEERQSPRHVPLVATASLTLTHLTLLSCS